MSTSLKELSAFAHSLAAIVDKHGRDAVRFHLDEGLCGVEVIEAALQPVLILLVEKLHRVQVCLFHACQDLLVLKQRLLCLLQLRIYIAFCRVARLLGRLHVLLSAFHFNLACFHFLSKIV
jgi:hypothetical protein